MLEITNALLRDHLKEKLRARSPLRRSPDLHEGADCFLLLSAIDGHAKNFSIFLGKGDGGIII